MNKKRRTMLILFVILIFTFLLTMNVSARQPEHYTGIVPLASYFPGPPGGDTVYDVCDPVLQGQVVQPADSPGDAVYGIFTMYDSPYCEGVPTMEGTCRVILLPVEEAFNPDSEEGRAILHRCTGDLRGLNMRAVIHYDFTYDAWYKFPR